MEKLLDPHQIKPVDKFFHGLPSCSTQSEIHLESEEEFIEMPESMLSKIQQSKAQIQFYRASCRTKNVFSFMDPKVKNEIFSFIEPKY